jgi:hypothetical protein
MPSRWLQLLGSGVDCANLLAGLIFPPTPACRICSSAGRPARLLQVARLRELRPEALASELEISTVDGFQGREKEAIIISMVRQGSLGVV